MSGLAPERVLFVVNAASFFCSHRLVLGRAARDAGYEVHVAAAFDDTVSIIESEGLKFHPLPLARSKVNPIHEVQCLVEIASIYRRLRPDIVHLVTIKPVLYGGLLSRILRIPLQINAISGLGYVYLADGFFSSLRRKLVDWLYRAAIGHSRSITIFQNPDDRQQFVERNLLRQDQTVLIRGSGVDTTRFKPADSKPLPPIVVLGARMLWDKGVGEFVEAARILKAKSAEVRMVLAGPEDSENPAAITKKALEEWTQAGLVEWWGPSKMEEVLGQASIACLPSYREGLPKFLLEAAAAGLPLVATDVPGCREPVENGVNGFLVRPQDPSDLAEALMTLLVSPEQRSSMGKQSRRLALRDFDEQKVASATLALYKR